MAAVTERRQVVTAWCGNESASLLTEASLEYCVWTYIAGRWTSHPLRCNILKRVQYARFSPDGQHLLVLGELKREMDIGVSRHCDHAFFSFSAASGKENREARVGFDTSVDDLFNKKDGPTIANNGTFIVLNRETFMNVKLVDYLGEVNECMSTDRETENTLALQAEISSDGTFAVVHYELDLAQPDLPSMRYILIKRPDTDEVRVKTYQTTTAMISRISTNAGLLVVAGPYEISAHDVQSGLARWLFSHHGPPQTLLQYHGMRTPTHLYVGPSSDEWEASIAAIAAEGHELQLSPLHRDAILLAPGCETVHAFDDRHVVMTNEDGTISFIAGHAFIALPAVSIT